MRRLALLVALAACAHTPDLPLRPDPAPPAGSEAWTFTAADGTQLFARAWTAAAEPRGVVVIMHGLKDDSGRYAGFAAALVAHGYRVYAFDLRGHGRSAGPRVSPDHWLDYVDDLDRFLTEVARREPGHPIFLFGHSMGGAIAARTAEVHPGLAGLVLSGPALAVDAPPLLLAFTRMAGLLTPGAPALKLPNRDFSSDPAAAAAMDRDPLVEQGAAPARTAAGLVDGMRLIWRDADRLTLPVLALHGTADKLTAPWGSRALVERIPAPDKRLQIYDGYYHDLLHEPGDRGPRVQADIVAWLDAHTGGDPPVVPPPPPPVHLAGTPRGWMQSVSLAAGVERLHVVEESNVGPNVDRWDNDFAGRLAVDIARPRPIGWYGALRGTLGDGERTLSLRPIGIAGGDPGGWTHAGISAGLALVHGPNTANTKTFAYSFGAILEQSTPWVHLSLFADYDRTLTLDDFDGEKLLHVGGTLRFPGDRSYWAPTHAGFGPALTVERECAESGGSTEWGCVMVYLLGLSWYGSD